MIQFLSIITTITGVFTILDLFIVKSAKHKVAEYVFGFGEVNLSTFENRVITALLSPFKTNGRLSPKKVLIRFTVIAMFVSLIIFAIVFKFLVAPDVQGEIYSEAQWSDIWPLPIYLLVFTLLCWPFDYWSLWLTHKLFVELKVSSVVSFIIRLVIDILLTLGPLILFLGAMGVMFETLPKESVLSNVVTYAMAVFSTNLLGAMLITIAQVVTLTIGIIMRVLLRATRLNQNLAMISRASEFPFTFIGVIFGTIMALLSS